MALHICDSFCETSDVHVRQGLLSIAMQSKANMASTIRHISIAAHEVQLMSCCDAVFMLHQWSR